LRSAQRLALRALSCASRLMLRRSNLGSSSTRSPEARASAARHASAAIASCGAEKTQLQLQFAAIEIESATSSGCSRHCSSDQCSCLKSSSKSCLAVGIIGRSARANRHTTQLRIVRHALPRGTRQRGTPRLSSNRLLNVFLLRGPQVAVCSIWDRRPQA
jgi:hypothetical protein